MADLIDREALYEKTAEWEATALHMVEKLLHREDPDDIKEWIKWSAVLQERTAFKHDVADAPSVEPEPGWIPCSERLPIKEFNDGRKSKTVYDIYPCLVTRYATHTDEPHTRTYVCKSYFDGEDFLLHGGYAPNEESDTENTIAWMPLPEPYKEDSDG